MSWAKVDDSFWSHHKVDALEGNLAAIGLWTLALSWVAQQLTDGFVPSRILAKLTGADVDLLARDLVAAGLWEDAPGGYRIHDYTDFNPDKETVLAAREAGRRRLAEWRRRNGVTNGVSNASPVPSRYIPVPERNGVTYAVTGEGRSPGPVPLPPRSAT
jgi:hypothetical protein